MVFTRKVLFVRVTSRIIKERKNEGRGEADGVEENKVHGSWSFVEILGFQRVPLSHCLSPYRRERGQASCVVSRVL